VRLRQLARSGFTLLLGDDAPPPTPSWPADLPVAVHRLRDLDADSTLSEVLGARPDETWVLRPDAHVAAVVRSSADLARAMSRAIAVPAPVPA
jgi:hypothetical protein